MVNTARNILIMLNNLATDALKTAKIQKAAEAVVIYLEIILRREMRYISRREKDRKLLTI